MSDDLRERIALAIARVPAGRAADAVLDAIAETAVIVERGRFEMARTDYISAVSLAYEKDRYLQRTGATVTQDDLDRWHANAAAKWREVVGDLEPLP